MFLRKAMRYYRLWIYTCNALLFAAVVVIVAVAAYTASHPYFPLVPGPPAYDLTYLYAYLALFLQAGVLQALGCFGAIRLSQKLLHIYWLLLLALLLGDIVVGLVWFIRFPKLSVQINTSMNTTLHEYGLKESSTAAWDSLQVAERCCGISSPDDYSSTRWGIQAAVVPASCCVPRGAIVMQADQAARHVPHQRVLHRSERPVRYKNYTCDRQDHRPQKQGCQEALRKWMHSVAEALMILGFCVITFIKLCFVGILKFEIQEMIEKIKVLQGGSSNTPNADMAAALGLVIPGHPGETNILDEGPTYDGGENGGGGERGNDGGGGGGDAGGVAGAFTRNLHTELPGNGNSSIGIREEPSFNYQRQQQNQRRRSSVAAVAEFMESSMSPLSVMRNNHHQHNTTTTSAATDTGGDSDTNSHSALITETPVHRPKPQHQDSVDKTRHNGNNNDLTAPTTATELPLHQLFHVRQTQI
uniref:CD82 antigen-like n=1 Tax=Hirondellea gigas TaxID=1518452 RepID=A0A6A7FXP9_9CRUS